MSRWILYCFAVAFAFLSVDKKISTYLMLASGLLFLISIFSSKLELSIRKNKYTFLLISPYIISLVGLLYTENIEQGLKIIEYTSSLLLLPILLSHQIFRKKGSLILILETFTLTLLLKLLYELFIYTPEFKNFGDLFLNFSSDLTKKGIHPVYYSSFLCFIVMRNSIILIKSRFLNYYRLSIIIISLILILLLSSKLILVTVFLFLSILFVKYFNYFSILFKILSIIIFISVVALILMVPNRALQEFNNYYQVIKGENPKSMFSTTKEQDLYFWEKTSRIVIWENSLKLAKKTPIHGLGTGDVHTELNKVYKENNELWRMKFFNSHNQFLDFYLKTGLFGVLSLSFIFFIGFKISIKKGNTEYLSFLVLMILIFSIENYISRQWGVVFFSTINSLFLYNNYKNE